jgi:hypothetical protein
MRKKTKALSGASKDAYLRRLLGEYPQLSPDMRRALLSKLREEIAQLRVRVEFLSPSARKDDAPLVANAADGSEPSPPVDTRSDAAAAVPAAPLFDPFTPNVIVVLRRGGRSAALQALEAIESPDNLRLLAREQRLSIGADVFSVADLRAAIVSAAERRVANRLAAAS